MAAWDGAEARIIHETHSHTVTFHKHGRDVGQTRSRCGSSTEVWRKAEVGGGRGRGSEQRPREELLGILLKEAAAHAELKLNPELK